MIKELSHLSRSPSRTVTRVPAEIREFCPRPPLESEIYTTKPPVPTIGQILGRKMCDHLEATPLSVIARRVGLAGVFAVGVGVMVFPEAVGGLALSLVRGHGYLLPRLVLLGVGVFKFGRVVSVLQGAKSFLATRYARPEVLGKSEELGGDEGGRSVGGVPADAIVDFLEGAGKFPAQAVCKRWGITTHSYQEIVAELSAAGLIERGLNNAWVLSPTASEESLDAFIDGVPEGCGGVRINNYSTPLPPSTHQIAIEE